MRRLRSTSEKRGLDRTAFAHMILLPTSSVGRADALYIKNEALPVYLILSVEYHELLNQLVSLMLGFFFLVTI